MKLVMGLVAVAAALLASSHTAAAAADDATLQLYKTRCQPCHMVDGNSPIADMNLADGKWIHGSSMAEIEKVISDGVPGKPMMAFKAQLTKEQIEALARHVRSFDKKLAPEKDKGAGGGR
jgi:cytochrome c oxidase cbb3-type subunit 3